MSSSVFKKWTDAVRHLNEKLKENRLIAGRNIQLENTGNGIRIHGSANSAPSPSSDDTYNGYFKVIQTADNKIKIVDGFADDYTTATVAGDALINDIIFNDIPAFEITINKDCFVYLISTAGLDTPNAPTIQVSTSKQTYELGKSKTLISRIKFADGKITKASQEAHGMPIGFIDGDCM